jgi:pilus retraction protein PilT
MLKEAITPSAWDRFQLKGDCEYVHVFPGGGRYRMVLMKQRFGIEFSARIVPREIRSFEQSGLPAAAEELIKWKQGLVLVTGPAGSGKTSTLATLVEMINKERDEHIITIEEPIEIVFDSKMSQVTQREIGLHTLSQENALRAALREDPDIVVVSELRDLRTIRLAVTAAETGHLVLGTMNTNCASQTVTTLIDSFPPDEQTIITNMISESLRGVVSQQLIPTVNADNVVSAFELLLVVPSVASLIRTSNLQQINNAISMGKNAGMVLLDESLQKLVSEGTITGKEAHSRAINQKLFAQYAEAMMPLLRAGV